MLYQILKYVVLNTIDFHVRCKRRAAPGSLPVGSSMAAIGIPAFRQGLFGISWGFPASVLPSISFISSFYVYIFIYIPFSYPCSSCKS